MTDNRPANCRNRLESEGKTHPKSGCAVEGCDGVFDPLCVPRILKPAPKPKPEATEISSGSSSITVYMPQWRGLLDDKPGGNRDGICHVGPHTLGAKWRDIPYNIVEAPQSGFMVEGIGIPIPRGFTEGDLHHGLPFPHAEALRWSAIAAAEATGNGLGNAWRMETRYITRKIVKTHSITETVGVEPNGSSYWIGWQRHGSASPVGCAPPDRME